MKFTLLLVIVGAICLVEARDIQVQRLKRGADMPCPPPPPVIAAHAKFLKSAKEAGLDIPALIADMSVMQCPPTPEMQQIFKTFVTAAVAKGIMKPDYADNV